MSITKSELDELVRWDDLNLGHLTLFVPLLSRELAFVLFGGSATCSEVTDKMTATINDVLALTPRDVERVKELLWEECKFAFVNDLPIFPRGDHVKIPPYSCRCRCF